MKTQTGIGRALQEARIAKGFSLEALARVLHWPVSTLEAVEQEAWDHIPPGQERPMVRQMAQYLDFDLEAWESAWQALPGAQETEPVDPRQARLERLLTGLLAVGSVGLLLWLVIPGPDIKASRTPKRQQARWSSGTNLNLPRATGGCPVVGEAIPEAPITEEGILIQIRAMDVCKAVIESEQGRLEQVLRVSEPWRVRVRGAFALNLDNAGVAVLEVAGRRIRHGSDVGEAWAGRFDGQGQWLLPKAAVPEVPPAPPESETDEEKDA